MQNTTPASTVLGKHTHASLLIVTIVFSSVVVISDRPHLFYSAVLVIFLHSYKEVGVVVVESEISRVLSVPFCFQ